MESLETDEKWKYAHNGKAKPAFFSWKRGPIIRSTARFFVASKHKTDELAVFFEFSCTVLST